MDLNRSTLIGNLTRDPEVRTTTNGKSVASVSIATNRIWTDQNGQKQKQAEFHNIVFWGKLADIAGQYLKKGQKTYIEGRLQTREWTGQDSIKRYRTEIVAENMIMLSARSANVDSGDSSEISYEPTTNNASQPSQPPTEVREEEIKVEDIPF